MNTKTKLNYASIGCEVPSQKGGSTFAEELNNVTGFESSKKGGVQSVKHEWVGEAFLKGQFQERDMWEYEEITVKLFDFAKPEELAAYSELIQKSFKEDPSVVILDEEKQFCQNAENWKVLLQFATIKYKKFLTENSDEEASRD